jgi:hypothetical protein
MRPKVPATKVSGCYPIPVILRASSRVVHVGGRPRLTPRGRSGPSASAIWWRRFDVCLGSHQVGGGVVHALLHNLSHCTHQGQLGDPLRLMIVGRPLAPRRQASVSTVNGARIPRIR